MFIQFIGMTTSGTQAQLEELIPVDTHKTKYNFVEMILSRETESVLTEQASSETLVGEAALVGDEKVVETVSLFNIEAVQLIPETFYYDYHELISAYEMTDMQTRFLVL